MSQQNSAISTVGMTEQQWLKERQKGIGGSDVAAIIGLNPYRTAMDVWLEKTSGIPVDKEDNPKMKAGRMLEEVVANWWVEESGMKVYRDNKIRVHPNYKFLLGNVDRLIVNNNGKGPGILEVKTTGGFTLKKWENEGWEMPPYWYCQVQHYMNVTGYTWGEVAVLIDGYDFRRLKVEANQDFIQAMLEKLLIFWEGNVLQKVPPDPQTEKDIMTIHPKSDPGSVIEASDEAFETYKALMQTKNAIKTLDDRKKELEKQIKLLMQDKEVLTWDEQKIVTWATGKSKQVFDTKTFAADHPETFSNYLIEKPGSRTFLTKTLK